MEHLLSTEKFSVSLRNMGKNHVTLPYIVKGANVRGS